MGTFDDARSASETVRQELEQAIGQLQDIGQGIVSTQQGFSGQVGQTSQQHYLEIGARCQEAKQRIAEAIQALSAAREAASVFGSSLC